MGELNRRELLVKGTGAAATAVAAGRSHGSHPERRPRTSRGFQSDLGFRPRRSRLCSPVR
jgi:hypothetical protein